jgi:hypothetical protein
LFLAQHKNADFLFSPFIFRENETCRGFVVPSHDRNMQSGDPTNKA